MSASRHPYLDIFRKRITAGAIFLCAFILSGVVSEHADAKSSIIDCKSTGNAQTGDQVTHSVKGKILTVTVNLKRGIGGAKVSWSEQNRPDKIVVELKQFYNLEAFSMSSGEHRFQTSLRTAPMIWGKDSSAETNEHELKPKVRVVQKHDKIIVTVPKEAFDWQVNDLQIGWIDAYR